MTSSGKTIETIKAKKMKVAEELARVRFSHSMAKLTDPKDDSPSELTMVLAVREKALEEIVWSLVLEEERYAVLGDE